MRNWSARRGLIATVAAVALGMLNGCAATQVQEVWRDEDFRGGKPEKVLVIAIVGNQTVRRTMEAEFARHLKDRGLQAVESFRSLGEIAIGSNEARDAIVTTVRQAGIGAVLIVRIAGVRKAEETIPGMTITKGFGFPGSSYGAWGGYSMVVASFPGPTEPTTQGYSHERKFLALDAQLFDVGTEKLIWAVRTETRLIGAPQEEISPYVAAVVRKLFSEKPW